jgi:predicted PurR-regulated permease PerM
VTDPSLSTFTRYGLATVAVLGGSILLYMGETILIPFVIALLLASLLWPVVRWLNNPVRLPWSIACLVVVVGLVLVTTGITLGLALSVPRLLQDLPDLRTESGQHELYGMVREAVARWSPGSLDDDYWPVDAKKSRIFNYVQTTLNDGTYVAAAILRLGYYFNNWLWQLVLILFFVLFLLLEGKMLYKRLPDVIGAGPAVRARAAAALGEMALQVRNYIWWRTVINLGLALACLLFYQYMGLRHAAIWALLTGILCYVPYLGPIAAGVPPIIEAFMSPDPEMSRWAPLVIMAVYIVFITMEGYFFFPWLIGRGMELNATTVLLACLYWEVIWGLPGLFLAMPIMAAIKAICEQLPDLRPWANLMSIEELEPLPEEVASSEVDGTIPDRLEPRITAAGRDGAGPGTAPSPPIERRQKVREEEKKEEIQEPKE